MKRVFASRMKSFLSALFCIPVVAAPVAKAQKIPDFTDTKVVDSFVDKAKWVLVVNDEEKGEVEFLNNHTLPSDKAVKLGSKSYRYWNITSHPTDAKKYTLRISTNASAGWYSFNWSASKKAWISKFWPKHQIKLK